MRKFSKFLTIVTLSLLVGGVANAQINVGISPGIQLPMGDFEDNFNFGYGGSVSVEYLVTKNIGVGLNAGYYIFEPDKNDDCCMMPIALTGKYYFLTEKFKPYGGVDVGYYILNTKMRGPVSGQRSESNGYIGLAPVLGFQYGFTNALALDINAKYNHIFSDGSSTSTLGFNVGLVYSFGKGKGKDRDDD